MSHSRLRNFASTAAKLVVSAGLIAFALRGVDSAAVVENMRRVDTLVIALAIVLFTSVAFLHARRWETILARMEHAVSYADALRLILIGYFFNQTLPSTVGGDAYRAWGVYKHGIHAGNAIASVIVDRVFALVALALMIGVGTWWLFDLVQEPTARAIIALVCAGTIAGFAVLLALPRFAPFLGRWRATRLMLHVADGSRVVVAKPAAVAEVLLLTFISYVLMSYVVYVLAQGMGVGLSMGYALLFLPLVSLVTILPVSIAGWGVRENAMVVSLGLISVPPAQALSISVLFGLVTMASGVPGGILWLLERRHNAPAADAANPAKGGP